MLLSKSGDFVLVCLHTLSTKLRLKELILSTLYLLKFIFIYNFIAKLRELGLHRRQRHNTYNVLPRTSAG